MALPKSTETPRLRYLHNLVDAANGEWADWPAVNKTDYTQIGKIIVLYSYIDVSIRRMVEAAENAGYLNEVWTGKVRKLKIGEAEEAVLSLHGFQKMTRFYFLQRATVILSAPSASTLNPVQS